MRLLHILAFTLLAASSALAEHYKLFVLTGQSNSLGVTNFGEADPTSGSDPADDHVKFYWHNVASATTSLGDSGGVFTSLQDQQGGYYPGSATHWGPEIEFSRTLYRAGVRNFGIIKASRGGGGNTLWSKSAGGHMYSHVVDTVTAATTTLTSNGDTFEIVGLLYVQGESNTSTEASIADTRFTELITSLRSDLPNATNMYGVIGGITAAGSSRDTTRAKHASLAAGDATISYIDNLDLELGGDNLHLTKAAKIRSGERFAQEFFAQNIVSRWYGKLAFIGDSITQGGAGHSSYRYQIFKNLAEKSVPKNATTGYQFVGSVTGAYQNNPGSTADHNGQSFDNIHDGHWGWRAFWENARVPLPSGRYNTNNLGQGTLLNWTGQSLTFETSDAPTTKAYTGTTYTPDTASILIGINDLAGGSSPTQVRDDISLMIDQLQAANPNVSIFLNHVLHTNQAASLQTNVDTTNGLLQALADSKTTATSSVWVCDPSTGFDPVTMTHDNVHPNLTGEIYVAARIAARLGLTETPENEAADNSPPHEEKDCSTFSNKYEGNEIYDGSNYINSWTEVTPADTAESLVGDGTDLRRDHTGYTGGAWLEGTNTGWSANNDSNWTLEIRMKVTSAANGIALWLGTGNDIAMPVIYDDRTTSFSTRYDVAHTNNDGAYHTFRVANDANNNVYHLWRDGVRLTPVAGVSYDSTSNDERLIIGDTTSGSLGDNYNVDIDYICYDQTGAYLPIHADTDGDGISDSWEYQYYGDILSADASADEDKDDKTTLQEFLANTDPMDNSSRLHPDTFSWDQSGNFSTSVYSSSIRLYSLYTSTDLGKSDPWTLVDGPKQGNDTFLILQDTTSGNSATQRFYRIEASLP
ncbi:protein of unknown function [Rubritalea squalenifaciens DSM 18772]|uniref:Lysophospholipase L1 n=1 Tax=Rubritalea squalenifaciens DSM 18772 TaxID=1123071 RepID=A0A1M6QIS9_9BACT|nr:sialate O-acetylesterase [Rubritalea squalenifaciens]SHK20106.1 protein of unknown function [Rubritalea squalenifaciens DSM 18772]